MVGVVQINSRRKKFEVNNRVRPSRVEKFGQPRAFGAAAGPASAAAGGAAGAAGTSAAISFVVVVFLVVAVGGIAALATLVIQSKNAFELHCL